MTLAAAAHLETRTVERILRKRSWDFEGLTRAERLNLANAIDNAIDALIGLSQESETPMEPRFIGG